MAQLGIDTQDRLTRWPRVFVAQNPNVRRGYRRGAFSMSFLQRFIERVLRNNPSRISRTSFDDLTQDQLDAHLRVGRYGNFSLTDAVRPSIGLDVIPRAGYRRDTYCDPESGNKMPVLAAAVSAENLFEIFIDLLDPLGDIVDVVMESSHDSEPGSHADLYREHMDTVILKSTLYDYESLLLHDGCTGMAALNPSGPMEVQFDEHKLLFRVCSRPRTVRRDFAAVWSQTRRLPEIHL
jgi:hypothetical protein